MMKLSASRRCAKALKPQTLKHLKPIPASGVWGWAKGEGSFGVGGSKARFRARPGVHSAIVPEDLRCSPVLAGVFNGACRVLGVLSGLTRFVRFRLLDEVYRVLRGGS